MYVSQYNAHFYDVPTVLNVEPAPWHLKDTFYSILSFVIE